MLTKNMIKQLYILFLCAFLTIQTIVPMPPQDIALEPSFISSMACFACICAGAAICGFINLYFYNEPLVQIHEQAKKQYAKQSNPEIEALQKIMVEQLEKLAEEAKQLRLNAQKQENAIENLGTFSKGLLMISISLAQQNLLYSQNLKQTQFITEMYNSLNKKNVLPNVIALYWLGKYTGAQKKLDAQEENRLQKKQVALENNMPQQ